MLGSSLRCYGPVKCLNGVLAIHTNVLQTVASCKQIQTRNYAKGDSGGRNCTGCCRDIDQKKGKRVEPWPKAENNPPACPPSWSPGCPPEPTPVNYDPYRIKVPDVMVSPLPPSNAKESNGGHVSNLRALFQNTSVVHPDYPDCWLERDENKPCLPAPPPRLSYHGKTKYKMAFHEPWKPLDRLSLLAEAEREFEEIEALDKAASKYK